ncbi:hypothetical protein TREMEDRAFT_64824 [Tremella mesenterica DSM 1558]|uniref:uncharacterized protein n=1 Tax=Tremella mesenterica (strain ATCC 24925 / CBS 8224 / DSM 1558 / NBRC 9311 / NRRL Y-6157 / RJB 2259-6 / UBC 559-6) TaxID=578456 RepID=UPI0003F48D1F|nr:uncharacterized protein TREMEDRAFT_64824 [Tremella mesenterica DSM 1558]EIW66964.1 hypothetical protein TREMEDRAFT_64824 [Tremella mesenterica DSM 1558]
MSSVSSEHSDPADWDDVDWYGLDGDDVDWDDELGGVFGARPIPHEGDANTMPLDIDALMELACQEVLKMPSREGQLTESELLLLKTYTGYQAGQAIRTAKEKMDHVDEVGFCIDNTGQMTKRSSGVPFLTTRDRYWELAMKRQWVEAAQLLLTVGKDLKTLLLKSGRIFRDLAGEVMKDPTRGSSFSSEELNRLRAIDEEGGAVKVSAMLGLVASVEALCLRVRHMSGDDHTRETRSWRGITGVTLVRAFEAERWPLAARLTLQLKEDYEKLRFEDVTGVLIDALKVRSLADALGERTRPEEDASSSEEEW